jgi:peptide deformylase
MAILPITKNGDPVLRNRCQEVDPKELKTKEMKTLITDMVETMYDANGIGIAANQVGVGKRLCIVETDDGPICLVNPVITSASWKKVKDEEGCLSVPKKYGPVMRAKTLKVTALTPAGEEISFEATNMFARIIQHEIDHLDGTLFIDKVEGGPENIR